MSQGFTVTPSVFIDEFGQEQVSYEHASVVDHSHRIAIHEAFNRGEYNGYYEDSQGNIHHEYEQLDPNVYETFEGDYQRGAELDDYLEGADELVTDEDFESLVDSVGGFNEYRQMVLWARNSGQVDEDFITTYDRCVDENDIGQLQELIQNLYEYWIDNRGEDDFFTYEDDQITDEEEQYDPSFEQFQSAVFQEYPNYTDALDWAGELLDEEVIDQYDNTMEYGSYEDKIRAINWLMNNYYTHN